MLTEYTSLSVFEQLKAFDEVIADLRNTVVFDNRKNPFNLEAINALSRCKIPQSTEHTKKYEIDWRHLENLLIDAEYLEKMQMDTGSFPRGQTAYNIDDVEEEILINTVIEMDGTLMSERKINDLTTTIFDAEHMLQIMNAKALEIIKKHTNPAGMMNRHYVYQSAAILHHMQIEMQVTSQATGSMDVMTRAQEEFSVLICDRKTQNRVMAA